MREIGWAGESKPLWPRRRGYWYFLSGSLMMEHNMNEAERLLKQALEIGLKQDHDKAAVKLNLAVVASAKRKTKLAKALLAECKRLDAKGVLKKDIKQVEAAIRSPSRCACAGVNPRFSGLRFPRPIGRSCLRWGHLDPAHQGQTVLFSNSAELFEGDSISFSLPLF